MTIIYDGVDLAVSMQAAVTSNQWLDLNDTVWRWDTPIVLNGGVLKIKNGTIQYGGSALAITLTINGSLKAVDVEWYRIQNLNIVGVRIFGGVRISLTRCNFTNFRNGDNVALQLDTCAIGKIDGCNFTSNDRHLEITNSSDIRIVGGGSFAQSFGNTALPGDMSGILVKDSAAIFFSAQSIENSNRGSLVELDNASRTFFESVRFEDCSLDLGGLYSHIHSKNNTKDTTYLVCSWNNTTHLNGVKPPIMSDDDTGERFYLVNATVPSGSPKMSPGMVGLPFSPRFY